MECRVLCTYRRYAIFCNGDLKRRRYRHVIKSTRDYRTTTVKGEKKSLPDMIWDNMNDDMEGERKQPKPLTATQQRTVL